MYGCGMSSGTREDLIGATRRLMLRQGYAATGINEICGEAGVSKGAFYHCFDTKEAVTIAALESFYRAGVEELMAIDLSTVDPAGALPLFVDRAAERASKLWKDGCLLGGLATEMAFSSETLRRHVARLFDQLAAHVARLAEPFVASLQTDELSATAIAEDFLAITEGAIVLSRAHRDPRRIRAALHRYAASLRRLPRR